MKQSILIATPCIDSVTAPYVASLADSIAVLVQAGIGWQLFLRMFTSEIALGRNESVKAFLASQHTDLMFIDSDINWNPNDLIRILRHPHPVIGGLYRYKRLKLKYAVRPLAEAPSDEAGLFEVDGIGAGFLRLRRDCIEQITKQHPSPFAFLNGESEDYSFCRRWRQMGGKVLADGKISLKHWGLHGF